MKKQDNSMRRTKESNTIIDGDKNTISTLSLTKTSNFAFRNKNSLKINRITDNDSKLTTSMNRDK